MKVVREDHWHRKERINGNIHKAVQVLTFVTIVLFISLVIYSWV